MEEDEGDEPKGMTKEARCSPNNEFEIKMREEESTGIEAQCEVTCTAEKISGDSGDSGDSEVDDDFLVDFGNDRPSQAGKQPRASSRDNPSPKAYILRTEPNPTSPDALLCWVDCPLCGDTHQHGIYREDFMRGGYIGNRVAHCKGAKTGDYDLWKGND